MSPFCGAIDTPILDFWWRLLSVSKPEWAALFALGGGICDIRSLRFTSGVTPVDLLVASQPTASPHACFSRGRMPDSIGRPPRIAVRCANHSATATGLTTPIVKWKQKQTEIHLLSEKKEQMPNRKCALPNDALATKKLPMTTPVTVITFKI